MLPENRVSTHPGEVLQEEFLDPLGITPETFAEHLDLSIEQVSDIVAGEASITPDVAWLFAQALETTPQFWMNLQNSYDLTRYRPAQTIQPLSKPI